jgi:hypothetical protein
MAKPAASCDKMRVVARSNTQIARSRMARPIALAALAALVAGGCASTQAAKRGPEMVPRRPLRVLTSAPELAVAIGKTGRPIDVLTLDALLATPSSAATSQRAGGLTEAAQRGKARTELAAGKAAFRELRLEVALAALGRARAALTPIATSPADFALLSTVALVRGRCLLALKRNDEAHRDVAWALRLRGLEPYPKGSLSPEMERFVALTRRSLDSKAPGTLSVDARVGARVWVDGVARGKAPLTVQLAPGLHHLRVAHPGSRPQGVLQRVSSGTVARAKVYLRLLSPAERLARLRATRAAGKPITLAQLSALDDPRLAGRLWLQLQSRAGTPRRATLRSLSGTDARTALRCAGPTTAAIAGCLDGKLRELERPTSRPNSTTKRVASSAPFYKRWWFWAIVGGVAAGAATGLAVGLHDPGTDLAITSQRD